MSININIMKPKAQYVCRIGDTTLSDTTLSDTPLSDTTLSDTPLSDTPLSDTTLSDTTLSDTTLLLFTQGLNLVITQDTAHTGVNPSNYLLPQIQELNLVITPDTGFKPSIYPRYGLASFANLSSTDPTLFWEDTTHTGGVRTPLVWLDHLNTDTKVSLS